ncbi:MAG: hypothetical protein NZZ41_04530 [Candidatus Dojkabacteria bacterium]|nr:hypothetical protein [Candidatus Dojkabacteria bacterium]
MGLFNTAKMIQQAMQTKKKMQKIQVVGYSGIVKGIVLDGLYNVLDIKINVDELAQRFNLTQQQSQQIAETLEKDIKASFKRASDELRKQITKVTPLDELKKMLE